MMEHDDDVILLPRMEDIDNCVGDENILVAVDANIAVAVIVVVAAVSPFAAVVDEDDAHAAAAGDVAVATTPHHQHHPDVVNASE